MFKKTVVASAIALVTGLMLAGGTAYAQQSSGSISVRASKGAVIVIENKQIGITRQVKADADGAVQVSQLPSGSYVVTMKTPDGKTESTVVNVLAGEGSVASFASLQTVVVTGRAIRALDVKSTESAQTLTKATIDRIPVVRDVTAVTLLAPGAVSGDARIGQTGSRSGNVPSLGGASPAENAYYINGFNVTNIVNGVAFNQVPYEGVAEQQVKTGGYGAEFGRSLGGVISVNTKRGTNEWHGGANIKYNSSSLQGSAVRPVRDPVTAEWSLVNKPGGVDNTSVNVWGGGPIIKDKLFVFGLIQGANVETSNYFANTQEQITNTTPQYLVKLDWNLTDQHRLELTAFSDKSKDVTETWISPVPYETDRGVYKGLSTETAGGENVIAKWTSWINDDLSISALAGQGTYDRSSELFGAECDDVIDLRTSVRKDYGCFTNAGRNITDPNAKDKRTAYRLDADWTLGKHKIKAGLDYEMFDVVDGTRTAGDGRYILRTRKTGQKLSNGYVMPNDAEIVEFRHFENGGAFKTINSAWYIEDNIQITDRLLASVGLRNESFTNKNAAGEPFIKVENTWAHV